MEDDFTIIFLEEDGIHDMELLSNLFVTDPEDTFTWSELNRRNRNSPEEMLFATLLVESCYDFFSTDERTAIWQKEAADWIFRDSSKETLPGFEAVCQLFELDPNAVRKFILKRKAGMVKSQVKINHRVAYSEDARRIL